MASAAESRTRDWVLLAVVLASIAGIVCWAAYEAPREQQPELVPALQAIRANSRYVAELQKLESLRASVAECRAMVLRENTAQDERMNAAAANAKRRYAEARQGWQDDPDLVGTAKQIREESTQEVLDAGIRKLKLIEIELQLIPAIERDIAAQEKVVDDAKRLAESLAAPEPTP